MMEKLGCHADTERKIPQANERWGFQSKLVLHFLKKKRQKNDNRSSSTLVNVNPDHRDTFLKLVYTAAFLLVLYILIQPWMRLVIDKGLNSSFVSIPFFLAYASAAFIFARVSSLSLSDIGITRGKFDNGLKILLVCTLSLVTTATVTKWLMISSLESWEGQSLFQPLNKSALGSSASILLIGVYLLFVPVQEFVVRGVILGSLLRCLSGRYASHLAILISSIVYSAVHSYMGIAMSLLVFVPGLVWGWMFYKTRSLLVVSVSHGICGLYVLLFAGLF